MSWEMLGVVLFFGIAIIGMFVRLEHRLTKIETDFTWLKKMMARCLPNLDKNSL